MSLQCGAWLNCVAITFFLFGSVYLSVFQILKPSVHHIHQKNLKLILLFLCWLLDVKRWAQYLLETRNNKRCCFCTLLVGTVCTTVMLVAALPYATLPWSVCTLGPQSPQVIWAEAGAEPSSWLFHCTSGARSSGYSKYT